MRPDTPTFMVVGAARCGTTTLHHLLSAHPQVHAPTKETYVATPELARRGGLGKRILSLEDHRRLYGGAAPEETRAMGEVGSCYLYGFREAIPRIRGLFGDPQIVIVLRDPAERAFSGYLYFARDGRDPRSFARAVDEELQGEVPACDWARHYLRMGFYADQVEAYLEAFTSVGIWLFDDLRDDGPGFASSLFAFLGVDQMPSLGAPPRLNASGLPKHPRLQRMLFRPTPPRHLLRTAVGALIGERRAARLVDAARRRGLRRVELDRGLRDRLVGIYSGDIERLESLVGRDLAHWRR